MCKNSFEEIEKKFSSFFNFRLFAMYEKANAGSGLLDQVYFNMHIQIRKR